MEASTVVYYFDGNSARPRPARLLVYDQALHLYETAEDHFIAAFPYQEVKQLSSDNSYVHFSLLTDRSQALDVPLNHPLLPEIIKLSEGKNKSWSGGLSRIKLPILVLIFLLVVVGIYYALVSGVSGLALQFISPKKEAELGKMIYSSLMENEKIDTAATDLLQKFASDLKLSEQYTLQFTVVDANEVNAFAIPGGHIVVYKGILQKMRKPEELVALLGHESTHVNERHSLRNMLQEMTGSFMLSMVFGDLGSIGGAIAGRANALRSLSYSRGLEEEADEKGMERMLKNKVNPNGMVNLMDRLKEAEKDIHLPGFLSTHPLTTERKANALNFTTLHPYNEPVPEAIAMDWKALKAEVGNDVPSPKN